MEILATQLRWGLGGKETGSAGGGLRSDETLNGQQRESATVGVRSVWAGDEAGKGVVGCMGWDGMDLRHEKRREKEAEPEIPDGDDD